MPIPKYLNCSGIPKALAKIEEEEEGLPPRREATKFCLVHRGKHYSPKVVVSYAHLFQVGEELDRSMFYGGRETNMWLGKCGYQILLCPNRCGGHGTRPNR